MLSGLTSQRETDGTKMKSSKGIILLFLALNIKVAVAVNYTQMFFIELDIEKSTYPIVTNILEQSANIDIFNAAVHEINTTTDCTLNETQKTCSCMTGYTWSEDICKKHSCCTGEMCLLKDTETAVCLSDKRVSISGSTTMENYNCTTLCDETKKQTNEYIKEANEIKDKLVESFSTLLYFDSLVISSFSKGSLVVNYTVQLLGPVALKPLENLLTTEPLKKSTLVTTGLIDIKVPEDQPIDIGSKANISCTPPEYLGIVKWFLTNDKNKTTQITEGSEAILKWNISNLTDAVELNGISGSWEGTFMCVYTNGPIKHTASKELDIALLPEIQALSNPQFPDCRRGTIISCTIECGIPYSKENYTVTWTTDQKTKLITYNPKNQKNGIIYKAEIDVCTNSNETVNVYCTFTNNRSKSNNNLKQKVEIPIIKSDSSFCGAEGDWPMTKNNYIAKLPCDNSVGLKTRACNDKVWKREISCVNEKLHDIQKDVEELNKGLGIIKENAKDIFKRIKDSTTSETFNSFTNINLSINIFNVMNDVSQRQSNQWNDDVIPDFVNTASNVLNDTESWINPETEDTDLSIKYLQTIERMVNNSNLSLGTFYGHKNVELKSCNDSCKTFNASVANGVNNGVVVVGFRNLHQIFQQPMLQENATSETTILSVTTVNNTSKTKINVKLMFDYSKGRLPNHEMFCVFWDVNQSKWSEEGCEWGGADNAELCTCTHNSAFTILMSKNEETLPYMEELTYVGLGISIVSLVLCLIIEILIWDTVVKSDISNFRHVAIFNICLCLLLAHCGFLASAEPKKVSPNWCSILTVVKHFFFLAVFFWMLCLSFVILHQIIFVFDHLRKKVFVGLSITLGYLCPILCVAITFITFNNGEDGQYYSKNTCWLVYKGTLKGSIFAFVLPVGTIVFINLFTLAVVIMKIVTPTVSEAKARDEKDVAKSMIKTIVFLSPVLGITWIFGFFLMDLDLTKKPLAQIVNYTFTVLNSLQGFFIFLTNCVGEKKVRDALRKRFKCSKQIAHSKNESSTKMTSSIKKK